MSDDPEFDRDIVVRLREAVDANLYSAGLHEVGWVLSDAADEIERLRAQVRYLGGHHYA